MCRARTLAEGSGRVQSAREQSSPCPQPATLATPRPMARIDRGELLTRTRARHGVREIFTLHGGHLDAAYQAESARRLRFIDTRHEQAAGHAADGWARTTGRVGVAMVTAGPGVTDVVTAVANAYLDCIPTLFIGGAAPLRDAETLPLQGGFDQLALMQPITKWAHRITQTARIPDLVTQALRVATTGRPGPVFLEIPIDVLFARVDEERAAVPAYLRPGAAPAPAAAAGARLGLFTGGREASFVPRAARVIQVDIAGEEIGRNRDVDLGIVADCRETLGALGRAAAGRRWPDRPAWQEAVRGARALPRQLFGAALAPDATAPIHPFRLAHEVAAAAGPEAVIVADGGETASW